jgi:hypothetical protein
MPCTGGIEQGFFALLGDEFLNDGNKCGVNALLFPCIF